MFSFYVYVCIYIYIYREREREIDIYTYVCIFCGARWPRPAPRTPAGAAPAFRDFKDTAFTFLRAVLRFFDRFMVKNIRVVVLRIGAP